MLIKHGDVGGKNHGIRYLRYAEQNESTTDTRHDGPPRSEGYNWLFQRTIAVPLIRRGLSRAAGERRRRYRTPLQSLLRRSAVSQAARSDSLRATDRGYPPGDTA